MHITKCFAQKDSQGIYLYILILRVNWKLLSIWSMAVFFSFLLLKIKIYYYESILFEMAGGQVALVKLRVMLCSIIFNKRYELLSKNKFVNGSRHGIESETGLFSV